jgi:hypothetical protein
MIRKMEILKFTTLLSVLSVGVAFAEGHTTGNGGFSYDVSEEVLERAKDNLLAVLPTLQKFEVSSELTEERVRELRRLIAGMEVDCTLRATDPVSGKALMMDYFPRKERNETGTARIFATKDFCEGFMDKDLETIDLSVPGVMRRILLEASHTWGFAQTQAKNFSEALLPALDRNLLINLQSTSPVPIAKLFIGRLEARAQAQKDQLIRQQQLAKTSITIGGTIPQINSLIDYMKNEIPRVRQELANENSEHQQYIKEGKDSEDRMKRILSFPIYSPLYVRFETEFKTQLGALAGELRQIDLALLNDRAGFRVNSEAESVGLMGSSTAIRSLEGRLFGSWDSEISELQSLKEKLLEIRTKIGSAS